MKIEIKVPTMGESISQATISRILKPTGSSVRQDEEIVELETDKVNQVLYAPQSGQINLSVKVGDTVKIDQVLGFIEINVQAPPPSVVTAEPPARKMSPEVVQEVVKEIKAPSPPTDRKRMSTLRRTLAQRLVEVKNSTAMLTTFNEVDMSKVIEIRAKEKEAFQAKYGVRLGFMSFFVKAVVAALKAYPDVRAYIEGDEIVYFPNYDIGVAVSTDKGLMVPVLRGCDTATFGAIEKQIEMYAKKAREGTITLDELRGGCFTITNGGIFGSLLSTPILNPPQSGILGMHTIQKRPVAFDDQVVIRPMMYLALSYDHRLVDGREAVQFLVHLKENLEDPTKLPLDF